MRIETCSFCSHPVYPSKGITFIRNDSRSFRFCKSKCHKNFKMKRNPRKLGWTKSFRAAHGKEMVVDGALALQARRNVPVRYNRETVATALRAMKRFEEVRRRRERVFYRKRMAGNRKAREEADRRLVAENQHLLPRELREEAEIAEPVDVEMDVEGEQELEEEEVEEMEVEVPAKKKTDKLKQARKLRMKVGGGVEAE